MKPDKKSTLGPRQKALKINLNNKIYGSFAEIGAGQEVARFFFQAGAASGTVAQTLSAYDMTVSDSIYGKTKRYVCEERVVQMLDHEYENLESKLRKEKGDDIMFFAFANTVAAKKYNQESEEHGWLGVKFQHESGAGASQIIIHVRMLDDDNLAQQQALGVVGVNLIYAAFHFQKDSTEFVSSLIDNLGKHRIEVDMIRVSGPGFANIDNRILSLLLVKNNMTEAVMFDPDGTVIHPSSVLYKKNLMILRGSFRPPTHVNMDMLRTGIEKFEEEIGPSDDIFPLAQITLQNLRSTSKQGDVDAADFLARVDLLGGLGQHILITNYSEYFRLSKYFSRYKSKHIRFVLGIYNLITLMDEKSYDNLDGGILEGFGRLIRGETKLYIYPYMEEDGKVLDTENFPCPENLKHLYKHLQQNKLVIPITNHDEAKFNIWSRVVLRMIQNGEDGWEAMVPESVATKVKEDCLFGYPCKVD